MTQPPADRGVSLVEVLVALAVLSVVMAATSVFFVRTVSATHAGRERQQAVEMTADALEKVHGVAPSDVIRGRDRTSVQTQWTSAPAEVAAVLADAEPVWDPDAALNAGAGALVPTADAVTGSYTQQWYVGACWMRLAATDCTRANQSVTGSFDMYRVVVAVSWTSNQCPDQTCRLTRSTVVATDDTEPVFDTAPRPYRAQVLAENPQFYWRLDDAAGSSGLADISGHNLPGVNPVTDSGAAAARYQVGGAPIGDGDPAAAFDGSGSDVISNTADGSGTADYSVELWFRTGSSAGGLIAAMVDQVPDARTWSRMMYVDSGGYLTYGDFTSATSAIQTVRSAATVTDGQWHQAVGWHSGTTLTLYLDGVAQGTVSSPEQVYGGRWVIGGANIGWYGWPDVPAGNFFAGAIDEYAFYTHALTPAQVAAHRAAVSDGTGYAAAVKADGPAVYWRLDDGPLSATAADTGSSGTTGHYYLTDRIVGHQSGALSTTPDDATWFSGRGTSAYQPVSVTNPGPFTLLLWFRSGTRRGGVLTGFADTTTGAPTNYDRHVWMLDDGRLAFGLWIGSASVVYSTSAYNDNQWHLAGASLGVDGQKLYVDGALVGQSSTTTAQDFAGYWRLGGSNLNGWPDASESAYFTGWLDEFAVLGTQLSDTRMGQLYAAR